MRHNSVGLPPWGQGLGNLVRRPAKLRRRLPDFLFRGVLVPTRTRFELPRGQAWPVASLQLESLPPEAVAFKRQKKASLLLGRVACVRVNRARTDAAFESRSHLAMQTAWLGKQPVPGWVGVLFPSPRR